MKNLRLLLPGIAFFFSFQNGLANTCSTAVNINSIPFTYTGTTVGAGNDYTDAHGCNGSYLTGNDFVFEYNSAGNEVVSMELNNLNDDYHSLYVFDGCPDIAATNCVTDGQSVSDSVFLETVYFQNAGTYFIVVSSFGAATQSYDFELTISLTVGNICENALVINNVPFTYTGTTVGAGNDYTDSQGCNIAYLSGNDFVFEYNSPGDEVLGMELENLNDDYHSIYVFDGCPDITATNCLFHGRSVSDSVFIETVHFQTAGTYYIVLSSFGSPTQVYDFEFTITTPIGNICENAFVINNVPYTHTGTTVGAGDDYADAQSCNSSYLTGNDFVFEYNSPGNEVLGMELENLNDDYSSLYVFDGCPDDAATNCLYQGQSVSDSVFIETVHFQNAGTYYIVVSSFGSPTQVYDFELTITTPIGNICENARQIPSLPYSYTGTTRGSGDDYSSGQGCTSGYLEGRDYIFEYTPLGDESISLTLNNINDDRHALFIIAGCPDDMTSTCYDFKIETSTNPININTSMCLTAGQTYYIAVSSLGISTQWYDFTLDIIQDLQVSIVATESSGLTNDNYLCADEAGTAIVNLTASASGGSGGGYSYAWDNAANAMTAMISELPNTSSTYTVTATDNSGCSAVQSYEIMVDPLLEADILTAESSGNLNDNIICEADAGTSTVTLDASISTGGFGNYSYLWNTGLTTAGISQNPVSNVTHSVTVTDDHQCTDNTSSSIIINPPLTATMTVAENSGAPNDFIICKYDAGIQFTLTANVSGGTAGYNYDWSPQSGSNMSLVSSTNVTNSYTVDVEDAVGCTITVAETMEIPITPIIWTGPTNRNWYDNPNHWNFGRFPTVCDDVIIPSGKLVSLRNGYHAWANTLDVEGQLNSIQGSEIDVVTN